MPIFGPPNVEKIYARRDVHGLINALQYKKDLSIPQQAALALGQIGDAQAIPALILALEDYHDEISQAAIKALAKIGPKAVQPLIAVLAQKPMIGSDITGPLRYRGAIKALGMIGDKRATGAIIAFITPIFNSYRSDDGFILPAAQALGRIGDPSAVEPLITILNRNPDLKTAWKALEKIGSPAINPLVAALQYPNITIRLKAGETLAKLGWKPGNEKAVAPLIEALNYPEERHRQAAAEILEQLGWKTEDNEAKAQYYIGKQQWDQCVLVGPPAVAPLIKALRDEKVRDNAANALVKIGKSAVEPLIAAFQENYAPSIRDEVYQTVAETLGKIGDERSIEPLITILINGNKLVRQAAARALIAIYKQGSISDAQKTRILAQRDTILKKHQDTMGEESCWHPGGVHNDVGIGIDFPL
jgi:HEAT repeat protein